MKIRAVTSSKTGPCGGCKKGATARKEKKEAIRQAVIRAEQESLKNRANRR